MAENQEEVPPEVQEGAVGGEEEDELTPGYKPPKQVDLKTIQDLDADDEALVKYKETLLGNTSDVLDEGGPNVMVKKMVFASKDRDEIDTDLTGDLSILRKSPIVIKEGCQYRIKIVFRVQREIVSGLRYMQTTYRKGIKVDSNNFMVGSYGPKTEPHVYMTQLEDAPSGMISRGHYTVKSKFTDDDKKIYLQWEWAFDIKKEWSE